jgi:hypothetical protein
MEHNTYFLVYMVPELCTKCSWETRHQQLLQRPKPGVLHKRALLQRHAQELTVATYAFVRCPLALVHPNTKAALGEDDKVQELPFCIRILLESAMRNCDGVAVTEASVFFFLHRICRQTPDDQFFAKTLRSWQSRETLRGLSCGGGVASPLYTFDAVWGLTDHLIIIRIQA